MRTLLYCACLMLALTGCGEPSFRCEKCKSIAQPRHITYYNGKTITQRWYLVTVWRCQDKAYHTKKENELKRMKMGEQGNER